MRSSTHGPYFEGQLPSECGHYYPDVQRLRDERREDGSLVRLIQCRWCGRSERVIDPQHFNSQAVQEIKMKGVSLISDEETWMKSSEDIVTSNLPAAFTLSVLANFAEVIPFVVPSAGKNLDSQAGYALLMRTLELFTIQVFGSLDLPSVPKTGTADELLHEMIKHNALPLKLLERIRELMDKRGILVHALESPVSLAMLQRDAARVAEIISWYWFEFQREHRVTNLDVPDRSFPAVPDRAKSRNVFLCYAREDLRPVSHLYDLLKKRGHNPWMDKNDLLPGQNWEQVIQKVIRESDFFVACLSAKSVSKKGFVQKEVRAALRVLDEIPQNQIFLIPVKLESCTPPDSLSSLHWIQIEDQDGVESLFRAIEGVNNTFKANN